MFWPLTMIAFIAAAIIAASLAMARLVAYLLGRWRKTPQRFLQSVESAYREGRAEE